MHHVFLALDLTDETLEEAIEAGADMIVTHHPMIFSGIKKINNHSFTGRRILKLVREGISYYAMHTNYDILGMADLSAGYLELSETKVLSATGEMDGETIGFGRVGKIPAKMTLKEYAASGEKESETGRCEGIRQSGSDGGDCSSLYRIREKHDFRCAGCRG